MTNAVIRVGDGRGFIVKDEEAARRWRWRRDERIVITAAHCLPFLPPCQSYAELEKRTYKALLGALGQNSTVWAECVFVDPVGDIAVLGPPENEAFSDECDAYQALVENITPLRIADVREESSAQLLSLDGEWFGCKVQHNGGPFWFTDAAKGILSGMSGSPILAEDGSAIGVVSVGGGVGEPHSEANPRLAYHLPTRFLPRRLPVVRRD